MFDRDRITAVFDPAVLMSEAIHVNQVGYWPDDPGKMAYLSQWMGLGGGVSYDGIRRFYLLNVKNERVFHGNVRLQHTGEVVPIGNGDVSSHERDDGSSVLVLVNRSGPVLYFRYAMRREMMTMAGFVPKEKLSRKAQRELNRQRRIMWDFSPVTRTVDSRKRYNRRKNARDRYDDYGTSVFCLSVISA